MTLNRVSGIPLLLIFISILYSPVWSAYNTNGEQGVVRTLSAKTIGKATLNIGAGFCFGQSTDYLDGPVEKNGETSSVRKVGTNDTIYYSNGEIEPARLFSSNIFVSFGLLSFWDLALSFPFYYDWSGVADINDGGIGDLEISTKLKIPSAGTFFQQGYLLAGTLPIGMKKNGLFPRHQYYLSDKDVNATPSFYSSEYPTLKAQLLVTFDIKEKIEKLPVLLHVNIGGVFAISALNQNNTAVGSIAIEYTPFHFLTLFTDLHAESRFGNLSTTLDPRTDPLLLSPGVKISTPSGMYLVFSGDFSLSSKRVSDRMNWKTNAHGKSLEYSTGIIPRYGAQFLFGWNGFLTVQDDDKDGIKNDEDRCPKDPEDIDGFEDDDGCPDPDNDKDGIPDLIDQCPNDPEDKDGFEDEDGCPDPDNDGDGIPDVKDQCPNMAEDFDGFEDRDGCPDPDNDKDGIPDSLDQCPNDVEDFDNFEDDDGCPDPDNDKDGIPDLKDKCPNEPEVFNNYEDKDGCPDTLKKEPSMPKQQLLQGINFKSGTPEMSFESYQYLEPIIRQLKQYPDVEIEIRGHTDSIGNYSKNMQLSQMRAEAVRQYIISKGIEAARVRAVGFGSSSPIADNRTAVGRTQNRRIEVIRLK